MSNTFPFEADAVRADEPIPRWKFWRRVRPPLEPAPCARCGADCRDAHVLIGEKGAASRFCFSCCAGAAEALR